MELTYFFDTYAFYKLINGNSAYEKYKKGIAVITTKLNLMELYYGLLREEGESVAENYFNEFLKFCVDFNDEVIKEANKFKLLNKKRKLSYVDRIGYILARNYGAKFLTGDKEFDGLANVEFVK